MFKNISFDWFKTHYGEDCSIAVIGNSSNVMMDEIGSEIDRYDVVCRMNNYQIAGYEKYIGTKTDLYITSLSNTPEITEEELSQQSIKSVFVSRPISTKYAYNVALFEMLKNYKNVKKYDPVFVSEQSFDELYQFLGLTNEDDGRNPTSGLTFLYCFLNYIKFKKMYITGFDFFNPNNPNGMHYYKGDYYDQDEKVGLIEYYHPRNSEIDLFNELIKNRDNIVLSDGVKDSLLVR